MKRSNKISVSGAEVRDIRDRLDRFFVSRRWTLVGLVSFVNASFFMWIAGLIAKWPAITLLSILGVATLGLLLYGIGVLGLLKLEYPDLEDIRDQYDI